jgi:hypothetical protein
MTLPYVVGTAIRVHLDGKRILTPRGAMIHDPSGSVWPNCSLLIVPIRGSRVASDDEYQGAPKHFLGRTHQARVAQFEIPSRTVGDWKVVGNVTRVDYVRGGTKAPGGYRHTMNKPRGIYRFTHLLKGGKAPVVLRKLGRCYRIDLPSGCVVDDRGIVYP